MIASWSPWMDVVILLAAGIIGLGLYGLVQLLRISRRERRRRRSRWDAWLDKAYAEAADLYRRDPLGGRPARWEDDDE